LRVVEAVAAAGDGVTAKAIARRLGVPLPSVYRALGTLVEEGYLVRMHDVRGYGLGYRVAELHRSLTEQVRPSGALRALLHEVHISAGAAAYLTVPRDVDIVVAHVDDCADHPRPALMRVGEPTAAHAIAGGKVVLAGLRPGRLAELIGRDGMPRLGPLTVSDRRVLDRELMRIRSDGAAVEVEEFEAGVAGIAAPVPGPGGETAGALGVSVSRAEFAARRWELERVVRRAAARAAAMTSDTERRTGVST
jgi:DNA-binding IclR family transcriptional regulator